VLYAGILIVYYMLKDIHQAISLASIKHMF